MRRELGEDWRGRLILDPRSRQTIPDTRSASISLDRPQSAPDLIDLIDLNRRASR